MGLVMRLQTNLERQTLAYWNISCIRRGRSLGALTIQGGIEACNQIDIHLGPDRRVKYFARRLLDEIIQDTSPPRLPPAPTLALVNIQG